MAAVLSAVLWYILTRDYAFAREPMPGIELVSGTGSNAPELSAVDDIHASKEADRVLLTLLPRRATPSLSPHLSATSTKPTAQQKRQRATVIARFRLLWKALEAHSLLGVFAPALAASSPSLARAMLRTLSAHSLDEVKQAVAAVARPDAGQDGIDGDGVRQASREAEDNHVHLKAKL